MAGRDCSETWPVKRHLPLLVGTALASFAVSTDTHLSAQTALPGYAASVAGATSTTTTTAASIISFGAGWNTAYQLHINAIQCGRNDAGTSAVKITFNDYAGTVMVQPNSGHGGSAYADFPSLLQLPPDSNLTMTVSAATTTVFCSAQGFVAN